MVQVGDVAPHAQRLIEVTQECLYKALEMVKPGATLGDIGHVIQQHAEKNYYSVVREYCGHGIGKVFHEEPQVLHYGRKGTGMALEPGMTFTIEPMINAGRRQTRLNQKDGWTVTTRDGRLSAQWEHTLGVTEDGCEVFTRRSTNPFPVEHAITQEPCPRQCSTPSLRQSLDDGDIGCCKQAITDATHYLHAEFRAGARPET